MDDLKNELKQLIIDECDKDYSVDEITDDEVLVGGKLDLDSLDMLQAAMAIKARYGVRIEGSTASRRAFKSINALADYIQKHQAA